MGGGAAQTSTTNIACVASCGTAKTALSTKLTGRHVFEAREEELHSRLGRRDYACGWSTAVRQQTLGRHHSAAAASAAKRRGLSPLISAGPSPAALGSRGWNKWAGFRPLEAAGGRVGYCEPGHLQTPLCRTQPVRVRRLEPRAANLCSGGCSHACPGRSPVWPCCSACRDELRALELEDVVDELGHDRG